MTAKANRQWRLAARPVGLMKETDFQLTESPVPDPKEGEFLVRNIYLSLDPTNRGWGNDVDTYLQPVGIGGVVRGGTIGVVEQSRNANFKEGSIVSGLLGWQDYAISNGQGVTLLPRLPFVSLTAFMGLFGHIGLTAYFGLLDIGKPKAGETLVGSAAGGAGGSLGGGGGGVGGGGGWVVPVGWWRGEEIGGGCHVAGIAVSEEKCRWITDELGFD